jgi:hypothetical protein
MSLREGYRMQESQGRIYDTGVSGKDIGYKSLSEGYRIQESRGRI